MNTVHYQHKRDYITIRSDEDLEKELIRHSFAITIDSCIEHVHILLAKKVPHLFDLMPWGFMFPLFSQRTYFYACSKMQHHH